MEIVASISACFRKYLDFTGKASRAEFWWFFCFSLLVCAVACWLDKMVYAAVAIALPLLAVTSRRLRDRGLTVSVALMLAIAPFIIFYFFLGIQDLVEAWFGIDVPYDLIATVPAAGAFSFFGLVLFIALARKDGVPMAKASSRRAHESRETGSPVLSTNPAVKARLEAERKLTHLMTSVMETFGLQPNADKKADVEGKSEADASIAVACDIVVNLCAHYGHGIYAPQFDKLFSEVERQLKASGWRVMPEGGQEVDLDRQVSARALCEHAAELRRPVGEIDIGSLLHKEKERLLEGDKKTTGMARTTACYTLEGTAAETFIVIEKLQTSYADTYLKMRFSFAEVHGLVAMKVLRSSTLYEAFRHSFSDRPAAYPAFGNRIITGFSPILYRDGLGISLTITDLGASSVKLLLDRGFRHPCYYIDFEMHERMM